MKIINYYQADKMTIPIYQTDKTYIINYYQTDKPNLKNGSPKYQIIGYIIQNSLINLGIQSL